MKKKGSEKLVMRRTGDFYITQLGENHCGLPVEGYHGRHGRRRAVTELYINYHLTITCNITLDKRGFLFKAELVDTFFENIKESKLSCENLVIWCANSLRKIITKDNPKCEVTKFVLELLPGDDGDRSMVYEWVVK